MATKEFEARFIEEIALKGHIGNVIEQFAESDLPFEMLFPLLAEAVMIRGDILKSERLKELAVKISEVKP